MFKGYLFVILSTVIYGLTPLMAKFIYRDGVNPMTLVSILFALALNVGAVLFFRKGTLFLKKSKNF